jgi:hypothetical protein
MDKTLGLTILLMAGCTSKTDQLKVAQNCATPLAGFHNLNDPDFTRRWPVGIEGYHQNTIKVSRTGMIIWNGSDLTTMHDDGLPSVEQFLSAVKGFPDRQPFTILDFDAGAPCEKVKAVRDLMVKHISCGEKDLCFQGNWDDRLGAPAP